MAKEALSEEDVSTCEHVWEFCPDWYGDPNVINGTADCSYWHCKKCDEETSRKPDDWEDGPNPDDERDRRIDDELDSVAWTNEDANLYRPGRD
jgi:hypothetical protein